MSYSTEAEQAVLGCILSGSIGADELSLSPEYFFHQQHRDVFQACRELAASGSATDFITVTDHMNLPDDLSAEVMGLAENSVGIDTRMVGNYVEIIRTHWVRRVISDESMEIASEADDKPVDEILARLDAIADKVQAGESDFAPDHKTSLTDALKIIDDRAKNGDRLLGVSSGLVDLDRKTSGFQAEDLVILAARPSMGKTALAINLMRAAMDEGPAIMFSLEMPRSKIIHRLIASDARVDFARLKSGQSEPHEWEKIALSVQRMHQLPFRIDDRSSLTPQQMRAAAKKYRRDMGGLSAIFVDYLQLMSPGKKTENETLAIGEISKQLKRLAKDFKCPVIALSQLNRSLESRENKRPRNSDLRQSGNIEQDADLILFLYRDEVYNENTDRPGEAEIVIGKARDGEIGTVGAAWQGHFQRFDSLAPGEWDYE